MTPHERRAIFADLKLVFEEFKKDVRREIAQQIKASSKQIYEVLTNQGIIECDERLISKAQIMKMYNVGRTKIEKMMKDGTLPYEKSCDSAQGRVMFRPADVRIAFESIRR